MPTFTASFSRKGGDAALPPQGHLSPHPQHRAPGRVAVPPVLKSASSAGPWQCPPGTPPALAADAPHPSTKKHRVPRHQQRTDYVAAQIEAIHQNLRFLEHVVTRPMVLVSDLRSLREAIGSPGAAAERDRIAFLDVIDPDEHGPTPRSRELALAARDLAGQTITLISELAPDASDPLPVGWGEWRPRATTVLARVRARLGASLRAERARGVRGLYVIIDPEHTKGRLPLDVALAALRGGAAVIQYRDKLSDAAPFLEVARSMQALCSEHDALFIVNDNAAIARLSGAGGLHVGQTDLPVADAREVLSHDQIIGRSNHSVQEALDSEAQSADYVAVGALYTTGTKTVTHPVTLDTLAEVKRRVAVPVAAIGGINVENARAVAEAGADAICVISAVTLADDPERAARSLAAIANG